MTEKYLMAELLGLQVDALYAELKNNPGAAADSALAAAHRQGHVSITNMQLLDSKSDVILLDRWYPSDAVFRRHLNITTVIEKNISAGIRIPDAEFAVTCDPKTSWNRAHLRSRKLDSKIIDGLADHIVSASRFEEAAYKYGRTFLRSDVAPAEDIANQALKIILNQVKTKLLRNSNITQ